MLAQGLSHQRIAPLSELQIVDGLPLQFVNKVGRISNGLQLFLSLY